MTNGETGTGERPRGILTDADRDFLRNRDEYSRQGSHARKTAIIDRTTNAFRDFRLLASALTDAEIEKIGEELELEVDDSGFPNHAGQPAPRRILGPESASDVDDPADVLAAPNYQGDVSTIGFLYRLYGDDEAAFEHLIAAGVGAGLDSLRGGTWTVDADIEPSRAPAIDFEETIEKLAAGDFASLSDFEQAEVIVRLQQQDALDIEALRESADLNENFTRDDEGEDTDTDTDTPDAE